MRTSTTSMQAVLDGLVAAAASAPQFATMTWRGVLDDQTDTVEVVEDGAVTTLVVNPALFAELLAAGEVDLVVGDEMAHHLDLQVEAAIWALVAPGLEV